MNPIDKINEDKAKQRSEDLKKSLTPSDQDKKSSSKIEDLSAELSKLPVNPNKVDGKTNIIYCSLILEDPKISNIDISSYISEFVLFKDYYNSFKPIYKLTFDFPLRLIKILEKSKNFKFHLNINTANYKLLQIDNALRSVNDISKMVRTVDIILVPIATPPSMMTNDVNIALEKGNEKAENTLVPYTLELLNINHVHSSNSLINTCYRESKMSGIVLDILESNKSACFPYIKNLIICPPDTEELYSNVFLTPMNIYETLKYLQQEFNIYNRKPLFFMDASTLYITKRMFNPTLESGESDAINVYVGSKIPMDGNDSLQKAFKFADDKLPLYVAMTEPLIDDDSAMIADRYPQSITVKSDTQIGKPTTESIDGSADLSASIKYAKNNTILNTCYGTRPEFLRKEVTGSNLIQLIVDDIQAQSYNIILTLKNIDISKIKPNTAVNLQFEDTMLKKYSGSWFIKTSGCVFQRTDSDIESVTTLELGRRFSDDNKAI